METTNTMYQQGGFGIGGAQPIGYQTSNPTPPKFCQPLTPEELESLKAHKDQFSLGLTQDEMIRSICFHRDAQKRETLRPNADGTVTCLMCGKTFYPSLDLNEEEVKEATGELLNVLQTTKLLYLDMPEEAAREFYQIIALIEKIPQLYKIASENFVKHENWNSYKYNYGPSTQQLYSTLTGQFGFGGSPMGQPMGQPMYGQFQQPTMAAPMMGQPMGNPFGFGGVNPMMGQQPQGYMPSNTGFQYTPNAQPAATAAPAVEPAVEVNGQFTK